MKTDIYTLAHEVKNPLSVVKGYLEMMNEENFSKYKEIIQNEVNISLEILDNYLEYNKLTVSKEEIDLNVLLLDLKNSMKDYLKKNNINLKICMLDDEIYLEADYNKLREVFLNIIKNGVEAHANNINISYDVMFNKVRIKIENDGDSIDYNDLSKIGNNYSNKVLGSGIGTTLSKKIIELHNGSIKYANNEKKGVIVTITLSLS